MILFVTAFATNAVEIVQHAHSDWEASVMDNSDEIHLQLVGMHQHIWSKLQHQVADQRYNIWKGSAEVESLEAKMRLNLKRDNHAKAKMLGEARAVAQQLMDRGERNLAAYCDQINQIESGTVKSFKNWPTVVSRRSIHSVKPN